MSPSQPVEYHQQTVHIIVAGLEASDKEVLLKHVCDTHLEHIDVVGDRIPVELPKLLMGELHVDSRLTARIWSAPQHWRHDYVNYLVNIKDILETRPNTRVMGMMVVVDSVQSISSDDEARLLRLIENDWQLPYMVLASHPYEHFARSADEIREAYDIPDRIPVISCDIHDPQEATNALIQLMYTVM